MLTFKIGDMLQADTEALVNTVNTVGVMGKGIALQFKEAFPHNNREYVEACKKKELAPGKLLAVWDTNLLYGRKLIINFPTKVHWRHPSKYEYIESGLAALSSLIIEAKIKSLALPPLGCGNGGLDWLVVKTLIQKHLHDSPARILVFEPNAEIKQILQQQETKKESKLTSARALLMYSLFAYESYGEYSSLFAANKLAYFLQRMGQPMQLKFIHGTYGPYAIGVEKVLYAMNGVYLNGLEQQQAKPFEPLKLNYEKWGEVKNYVEGNLTSEQTNRLNNLIALVNGYTSELSLEILGSVAIILDENPNYNFEQVLQAVRAWSTRKANLFKESFVHSAYLHLNNYKNSLEIIS